MKTLIAMIVVLPLGARAATIAVNTNADKLKAGDGRCTLREAINNVNAAGDTTGGDCAAGSNASDTILFNLSLPATIRLDRRSGELVITRNASITGPGPDLLAVSGGGRTRVFHVVAGSVSITNLTVRRGRHAAAEGGRGGGILVDGGATLNLTDCILAENKALPGYSAPRARGGALAVDGTATLAHCILTGNIASSIHDAYGGAADIAGEATFTDFAFNGNEARAHRKAYGGSLYVSGQVTLTSCAFGGNIARTNNGFFGSRTVDGNASGGAVEITGNGTVADCIFSSNAAKGGRWSTVAGGAIELGGDAVLDQCTFSRNLTSGYLNSGDERGGAIDIAGTATLTGCTFSQNGTFDATLVHHTTLVYPRGNGGGLAIVAGGGAALANCTLDGNSAYDGGGISNIGGTAVLNNCTLNGNTASSYGGGIYNQGSISFTNCTVSGNTARFDPHCTGGGFLGPNGQLANTIIALNRPCDCNALPTVSNGHNLDSDGTCFPAGGTDLLGTDPMLAPLGDYGGATQTMALCTARGIPSPACTAASPTIDAGDDSVTGPPLNLATDQRGQLRLAGAHVDMGAYEVQ